MKHYKAKMGLNIEKNAGLNYLGINKGRVDFSPYVIILKSVTHHSQKIKSYYLPKLMFVVGKKLFGLGALFELKGEYFLIYFLFFGLFYQSKVILLRYKFQNLFQH